MSGLNKDQQNMLLFLKNMEDWVKENPDDVELVSDSFDDALDELLDFGFLGPEGQNDPRGDHSDVFHDGICEISTGRMQVKE